MQAMNASKRATLLPSPLPSSSTSGVLKHRSQQSRTAVRSRRRLFKARQKPSRRDALPTDTPPLINSTTLTQYHEQTSSSSSLVIHARSVWTDFEYIFTTSFDGPIDVAQQRREPGHSVLIEEVVRDSPRYHACRSQLRPETTESVVACQSLYDFDNRRYVVYEYMVMTLGHVLACAPLLTGSEMTAVVQQVARLMRDAQRHKLSCANAGANSVWINNHGIVKFAHTAIDDRHGGRQLPVQDSLSDLCRKVFGNTIGASPQLCQKDASLEVSMLDVENESEHIAAMRRVVAKVSVRAAFEFSVDPLNKTNEK